MTQTCKIAGEGACDGRRGERPVEVVVLAQRVLAIREGDAPGGVGGRRIGAGVADHGVTVYRVATQLGSEQTSPCTCKIDGSRELRVVGTEAAKVVVDVKYVGFDIPTEFVVGYGLDFNEKYRNLDFIGVLAKHMYS